jgi:hypothetical protein
VYLKDFRQVTNLNRNKIFNDTPGIRRQAGQALKKDYIIESGQSVRSRLQLKYETEQLLHLGRVQLHVRGPLRWAGEYNPVWDRRHNMNLVASHAFGKFDSLEGEHPLELWIGLPLHPNAGFLWVGAFQWRYQHGLHHQQRGPGHLFGPLNQGRLPTYHRMDLGMTKIWRLDENQVVELDLSLTNTYDRANIFYFDRVRYERVDQLPLAA